MTLNTITPVILPARRALRAPMPAERRNIADLPGCSARQADICRTCPARCGGFCGTLSKPLNNRVSELGTPAVFKADHWFWDAGSPHNTIFVVREGYLRLLRYSADGRRLITGLAGPGAVVGETLPDRGHYGLESVTDVSLCVFDRKAFEHLRRTDAEFRRLLYAERKRCLKALHRHIWMRGLQSPEERLAAFLVRACDMLPYQPLPDGGGVLTLDIPRADIADLIGTTRETISRFAQRWQEEHLISSPDRGHLILHDRVRLAERGGVDLAALDCDVDLPPDVMPLPESGARGMMPRPPVHLHYL